MLKQFDIVQIKSAKNIKFLSGPPGRPASPQGNWSVIGFIGSDVLISKDETVVRTPLSEIRLIASYNPNDYINRKLTKEAKNGEEKK